VPLLKVGDLVGRREVVRTIVRVLTDDHRAVDVYGVKAGCAITGIGGVGKSTVAGRVMERLASRGWCVAAVSGALQFGELALAVGAGALTASDEGLRIIAKALCDPTMDDNVRLKLLAQVLANHPVLLVLDNFEDNLTPRGGYRDPVIAKWIEILWSSAHTGRLLVTSRYPLPNSEAWLATMELGPLSNAQTAKLLFRHPRLRDADSKSVKVVQRVIGGHPRMIEYLDAILNRGRARLASVEAKLRALARKRNIDLDHVGSAMEEAIHKALEVGAADVLLDELLAHRQPPVTGNCSFKPRCSPCLSRSRALRKASRMRRRPSILELFATQLDGWRTSRSWSEWIISSCGCIVGRLRRWPSVCLRRSINRTASTGADTSAGTQRKRALSSMPSRAFGCF